VVPKRWRSVKECQAFFVKGDNFSVNHKPRRHLVRSCDPRILCERGHGAERFEKLVLAGRHRNAARGASEAGLSNQQAGRLCSP